MALEIAGEKNATTRWGFRAAINDSETPVI